MYRIVSYASCAAIPDHLWPQLAGERPADFTEVSSIKRGLTLGLMGCMQSQAHRQRADGVQHQVVVAFDGDIPVGWVLKDQWFKMQLYVRTDYRCRGIATALVQRLWSDVGRELDGYTWESYVSQVLAAARRPVVQLEPTEGRQVA